ncbi:hypothetical protein DPMN_156336 [Dreissena polymorpha]|uniref:Uncharacterized protein n=1 Tax=Dreissena polymorpha TaxID=45954 RepID=A0A9D4FPL7_DREPO|nr:hypothetical protein DPMN_156336 [Dreissena polymorpha]
MLTKYVDAVVFDDDKDVLEIQHNGYYTAKTDTVWLYWASFGDDDDDDDGDNDDDDDDHEDGLNDYHFAQLL